jgi:hypothetical protein
MELEGRRHTSIELQEEITSFPKLKGVKINFPLHVLEHK